VRLIILAAMASCLAPPVIGAMQNDAPVYRPGNGVTLPTVVRQVKAEYSQEAKDQRIEGTVLLDCNAVEALRHWEFKPGTKDGRPVAVQMSVEMSFTLK